MDKKIFYKKRFFFLSVTFFFFIVMLFLYLNVSNIMYNNASILLAIKETRNLKTILTSQHDISQKSLNDIQIKNLNSIFSKMEFYPPIFYIKIFNGNGNLLYQWGKDSILSKSLSISDASRTKITYNKTMIKDKHQTVYEVIIPGEDSYSTDGWFLNILFDIQAVDNAFFKEKRVIFLIVFVVNLFIIAFLMMMILNLQKRLYISENELAHLTISDKLTNLLTKDALFHEIRMEIDRITSHGGTFSLITADIDNFITINDKCGFDFGNHILKNISHVFKESYRNFDVIGRYGGDEIVVLMIGASEEEAKKISEECKLSITETDFFFEGEQIPVTMSFGIAATDTLNEKASDIEVKKRMIFRNILFNSLNALSRAKRDGKNKVITFKELADKSKEINL